MTIVMRINTSGDEIYGGSREFYTLDGYRIPRSFTAETSIKEGKQGKNWPEFKFLDKFLDKLQHEVGIVDS